MKFTSNENTSVDVKCNNTYIVTFKEIEDTEINKDTYDKDFKTICNLQTVNNLVYFLERIKEFKKDNPFYINVFKDGIQPLWEDENNKNGCSWSLVLKQEISQRFFEKLLVRMCTGFFKTFEPTGIVGVNKDGRFKLSIWSKNIPLQNEHVNAINEIKSALEVNYNISFQYKKHNKLWMNKEDNAV